jgi:SpoVK/Ycf46/Vps4 family AAA+-type ATPase
MGKGDYTKERDELLEDIVTMDDFKENLKNLKGNNSNK